MKIQWFLFLLFFLQAFSAWSQSSIYTERQETYYRSFSGEFYSTMGVVGFSSNREAQQVVSQIVDAVGLQPNFTIQAADVPNAAAVFMGGKRLILYNPSFMQQIRYGTRTYWSMTSIVAHEIGHHLNGHTLEGTGSHHAIELEADEFSGFVLARMGASLGEAQAAMRLIASEQGSSTHPPRSQRLQAIERGWRKEGASGTSRTQDPATPSTPPERRERTYPREPVFRPSPPQPQRPCPDEMYYDPQKGYYIRLSQGGGKVILGGVPVYGQGNIPAPRIQVHPPEWRTRPGGQGFRQRPGIIRQGRTVIRQPRIRMSTNRGRLVRPYKRMRVF